MLTFPERYSVIEKVSTISTNADAKALAEKGAPAFTLVWAHEQSNGRGRGGRKWISEPGNLYWSLVLRQLHAHPAPHTIVFVAAMAVVKTLQNTLPDPESITIKWPNDVLIDDAKVSGILTECNSNGPWTVVGIGINIASAPPANQTSYPATCLADVGSSIKSAPELCKRLSAEFAIHYDRWLEHGLSSDFQQSYHERMWKYGMPIEVGLNLDKTDSVSGINQGIDHNGHLQLQRKNGEYTSVNVGDILFNEA